MYFLSRYIFNTSINQKIDKFIIKGKQRGEGVLVNHPVYTIYIYIMSLWRIPMLVVMITESHGLHL